jgi:hypothetical protein
MDKKIRILTLLSIAGVFFALGGASINQSLAGRLGHRTHANIAIDCSRVPIEPGQTIQGAIEVTDCQHDSSLGDLYIFDASAGDQITVTLSSIQFDTFLELLTSDGIPLTNDDDGGRFSNSRIVYKIENSGSYNLRVRSLSGIEVGSYELGLDSISTDCLLQPVGLVMWFKGDNTAEDSAGGVSGVFTGTFATGKVGPAMQFTNSNSYRGTDRSLESTITDRMSVALWMNADQFEGVQNLVSVRSRNNGNGFTLSLVGEQIRFQVIPHKGAIFSAITTTTLLTPGAYHHIAATFDGKSEEMAIYVNGVAAPVSYSHVEMPDPLGNLYAGEVLLAKRGVGNEDFVEFFSGLLDEVQIFNESLVPAAASSIANANQMSFCANHKISGNTLPNVTIGTDDGTKRVLSDADGNYDLYLESRRSYTVRPELSSHTFAPSSYSYEGLATDLGAQNFTHALKNDDFENAIVLAGDSGDVSGHSQSATRELAEPLHAGFPGFNSVWYRWVAPRNGEFTFSLAGSPFDTLLAIYTGNKLSDLTQVAANDNVVDIATYSRLTFSAAEGTEYRIAIDGKPGAFPSGSFRLVFHGSSISGSTVSGTSTGLMGALVTANNAQGILLNSVLVDRTGNYTVNIPDGTPINVTVFHHVVGPSDPPSPSFYVGEKSFYGISQPRLYNFARNATPDGAVVIGGNIQITGGGSVEDLIVAVTGASLSGEVRCSLGPAFGTTRTFTCGGLPDFAKLRITPTKPGISFSPSFIEKSGFGNYLNARFFGSATPGFRVTGQITAGGSPLLGATVILNSSTSVNVDSDGYYLFENLPRGQYKLKALIAGFSFEEVTITDLQSDEILNFQGTVACEYTVTPMEQSIPAEGGFFFFDIETSEGCNWSASTTSSRVTIAPETGSGSKKINYFVETNPSTRRVDLINVVGRSVILTQASGLVTLGGRALTPNGLGLKNAQITLTDSFGTARKTLTSSLGFYSFEAVRRGGTYTVGAHSKRYRFASRSLTAANDSLEFDLIGLE